MHDALMAGLKAAAANPEIRCVVLTGAGRGFCAGQDLSDPAIAPDLTPGEDSTAPGRDAPAPRGGQPRDIGNLIEARTSRSRCCCTTSRCRSSPRSTESRRVPARTALNCDIVLAARSASFIQAFSKIGLIPDCGGTWLLPRLAGRAHAMALALLGDKLPAEQAERIGLIWRCVDDAALAAEAQSLAERLATMPSKALANWRAFAGLPTT